jgi:Protein of unknown function (DUF2818)
MENSLFVYGYWCMGLVFANTPFFLTTRLRALVIFWLLSCGIFLGLGFFLESRVASIQAKTLAFYVVFIIMFLVLGLPGFVVRFLKKG